MTAIIKGNRVIQPEQELLIKRETDVLVVGGGPAGVATAVAAQRAGVDVTLVERYGFLGGLFTGGMVLEICGMYVKKGPREFFKVCRGIGDEILQRIANVGAGMVIEDLSREDVIEPTVDPEAAKYVLDAIIQEAGVKVLFHCWGGEVIMDGNTVKGVVIESKSGRQAILAKVVVDATGDGDLFARASAAYHICTAPIGLVHRLGNIDRLDPLKLRQAKEQGIRLGNPTPIPGVNWVNMRGEQGDCLSIDDLSRLEMKHRKTIWENVEKMRETSGFEEIFLVDTAPQIGVRVSRLLKGMQKLTLEEARQGKTFFDVIAVGGADDLKNIKPIQIPLGVLIPRKVDNLLAAGRCISVETDLIGDIRLVSTCFSTGHAAGVAAAVAVMDNCLARDVSIHHVQNILLSQGAYLG